jgi:hypothetical protein
MIVRTTTDEYALTSKVGCDSKGESRRGLDGALVANSVVAALDLRDQAGTQPAQIRGSGCSTPRAAGVGGSYSGRPRRRAADQLTGGRDQFGALPGPRRITAGSRFPGTGRLRAVTFGHWGGDNRVQKCAQGAWRSGEDMARPRFGTVRLRRSNRHLPHQPPDRRHPQVPSGAPTGR